MARVTGNSGGRPRGAEATRPAGGSAAPITLVNPDHIYDDLLEPSLVALWLSQLIVFAVYPRFAARRGDRVAPAWVLAAASSAFGLYGPWATIQRASS
jgi:hypothetical protein